MFSYIDTIQNLTVAEKRNLVKSIKLMIKEHIAANRDANFQRKQNSALLRAQKKQDRIAKFRRKVSKTPQPHRRCCCSPESQTVQTSSYQIRLIVNL